MDDDKVTCEICMETYDNTLHIPKQLPCCSNNFCLNCLNDIYKRNNNNILCPICRKTTQINPSSLKTDNSVFASFLSCLNCNKPIIKSEVHISLDTHNFTCVYCANKDMILTDFLEYIIGDLDDFTNANPRNSEMNIKQFINVQVTNKLNEIFTPLINDLKNELIAKITNEIKTKYQYDIETSKSKYNSYFNGLTKVRDNIKSFIKDVDMEVNLKQLQKDVQYYTKNFDEIKGERNKNELVDGLLKEGNLFQIKMNMKDIKSFLMNIFDTKMGSESVVESTTNGLAVFEEKIHQLEKENNELKMEMKKLFTQSKNNEMMMSQQYSKVIRRNEDDDCDSMNDSHNFGYFAANKIRIIDIYEK